MQVRDKREVFKILEKGSIKRQTAETKMNANSSRSHTVFTVTVFVNQQSIDGQDMLKIGKQSVLPGTLLREFHLCNFPQH